MSLTVKNLICHVDVSLPQETVPSPEGRPLDLSTLSRMESLLGEQLQGVRVHTDSTAATSARALGAEAFITGRNIYFGEGRFDTTTGRGLGLLAHELVHHQQQRYGTAGEDAEMEALRIEREVSAADKARRDEIVYLDGAPVPEEEPKAPALGPLREPEPPRVPSSEIEETVTEKVLALMRSELTVERERRGALNPSAGRLPL